MGEGAHPSLPCQDEITEAFNDILEDVTKDQQIDKLNTLVRAQKQQIDELNARLHEKDQQLAQIRTELNQVRTSRHGADREKRARVEVDDFHATICAEGERCSRRRWCGRSESRRWSRLQYRALSSNCPSVPCVKKAIEPL